MAVDLEYYGVPPADYREQELRNTVVATAGQTTISAPYSVGYVDVYFNGAKLDRYTEFTATDGVNIVLATAANAGDVIEVISRAQVQLANVYTQQQVNSLLVPYFGTATGTGDAQILVTTPTFTSYVDGMDIKVRTAAQNTTTSPTINCNGLGAKVIVSNNAGAAVYGQDWVAGAEITLRYNQTLGKFILIDGGTTVLTASRLDNSNQSASTAYVQSMLGNFQSRVPLSANTTLTAAQSGSFVELTGSTAFTVTLPANASNLRFTIYNAATVPCTITAPSGVIYNGGGTASVAIQSSVSLDLVCDGVNWINLGGMGAASLGSSGYQRLPTGLIIQWGSLTVGINTTVAVTFPVAFPSNCYVITHGFLLSGGNFYMTGTNSITLTGFNFLNPNTSSATSEHWIAIGR